MDLEFISKEKKNRKHTLDKKFSSLSIIKINANYVFVHNTRCEKFQDKVTNKAMHTKPRYASAVSLILASTTDVISSGETVFISFLYTTLILGLPASLTTVKGQHFMSDWTVGSSNLRPIRRLAPNTVLDGFVVI